mmetsp:Transcript_26948/g.63560  ORF Transcript_26948/g.63560 Transcript_26948/m.63560 type:complete len:213 (-) Transcript_26948:2307-2945(-)
MRFRTPMLTVAIGSWKTTAVSKVPDAPEYHSSARRPAKQSTLPRSTRADEMTMCSAGEAALVRCAAKTAPMALRSSWERMQACSSVRSMLRLQVVTRVRSTLRLMATSMSALTAKLMSCRLIPSPYCPSSARRLSACVSESISMRRVAPPASSSRTSATMIKRCESKNRSTPTVCCGAHSYPGLIQYARWKRPLSLYLLSITCEKLRPSVSA